MAQYGLEFSSHENELDKRTSLCIAEKESLKLCDLTTLSFDLQFKPYQHDYFGYIFRLILNDVLNIDLIYDRRPDSGKHFKLVVGDKFTNINFDIPSPLLFYSWNNIQLTLDKKEGKIILSCLDNTFQHSIDLKKMTTYKLFYGFNNYASFQSSDLPPMRIKDVKIKDNSKLIHHWKLDQTSGNESKNAKGAINAIVGNPSWIKRQRQEWKLENDYYVSGQASVAFDNKRECIYIVSEDSLIKTYMGSKVSHSWPYLKSPLHLVNGSQSIYNPVTDQVMNISIDQKNVSVFDTLTSTWTSDFEYPAKGTHYLHFNKFYSERDSSIYMVAGYGHFHYKNTVHKYHVPTARWDSLVFKGDKLFPHYLGALGVDNGNVYLLGGYGSATGDQMLNPKISNDLVKMNLESREFKQLAEVDFPVLEGVWANSLVIDDRTKNFHGLMFPKNKFKSFLQLVSISSDGKNLKELGSTIPFDFHDIRSFADLYYSKASNRFVAVTLFYDSGSGQSRVRIYSLLAPAMPYVFAETVKEADMKWLVYVLFGVIGIIAGYLIYSSKKKRKNKMDKEPQESVSPNPLTSEYLPTNKIPALGQKEIRPSIYLFRGDIQVFDKEGINITKNFSPLLKELLTMFVVYTVYKDKGVSSDKLIEMFWSDKSSSSATNNRSVNIAKLNGLLESLGNVKISKKSGYWCLENIAHLKIDLFDFMQLSRTNNLLDQKRINNLLELLENGGFMYETDYEWLDGIKEEISIHAIGLLSALFKTLTIDKQADLIVEVANRIFHFDPVNEEAMIYKCKALVHLGYHSLAHQAFEHFSQVYQQLYAEPYTKVYRGII